MSPDFIDSINWVAALTYSVYYVLAPSVAMAQLTQVTAFSGTASGDLLTAIRSIVNAILGLIAVIAVIYVIVGGVKYITAQGDDDAVATAKNTILYALLGVIVIILSAVLVNFIIGSVPE